MTVYDKSATMQGKTTTPDDAMLSTAVTVKMTVAFSAKRPTSAHVVETGSIAFSAKQPGVTYTAKRS